ncbi:hypothetical protein BDR26DRAFT_860927 [Obelidium mucronatum]|nr:hypothetical protein BDR26DRAFT_860927 [Obelidium mucronatum]
MSTQKAALVATAASMLRRQVSVVATSTPDPFRLRLGPSLTDSINSNVDATIEAVVLRSRTWARNWLGLFRESTAIADTSNTNEFLATALVIAAQQSRRKVSMEMLDKFWLDYRAMTQQSTSLLRDNRKLRLAIATLLQTMPLVTPKEMAIDRLGSLVKDLDREDVFLTKDDICAMAKVYAHSDCDRAIDVAFSRPISFGLVEALGWIFANNHNRTSVERMIWRWCSKHEHKHIIPHHILTEFLRMLAKVKSLDFALALYDTQKLALDFTSKHHPEIINQLRNSAAHEFPLETAGIVPRKRVLHQYRHLPLQVYKELLYLLGKSISTKVLLDSDTARKLKSSSRRDLDLPFSFKNPFTATNPLHVAVIYPLSENTNRCSSETISSSLTASTSCGHKKVPIAISNVVIANRLFREALEAYPIDADCSRRNAEIHLAHTQIYNHMLHIACKQSQHSLIQTLLSEFAFHGFTPNATALNALSAYQVRYLCAMTPYDDHLPRIRALLTSLQGLGDANCRVRVYEGILMGLCAVRKFRLLLEIVNMVEGSLELSGRDRGGAAKNVDCRSTGRGRSGSPKFLQHITPSDGKVQLRKELWEFCIVKAGEAGRPAAVQEFLTRYVSCGGDVNAHMRKLVHSYGARVPDEEDVRSIPSPPLKYGDSLFSLLP